MGQWVKVADRLPEVRCKKYTVLRRVRGEKTAQDEYLWNGAYWVTLRGSPSMAVVAWWEEEPEKGA